MKTHLKRTAIALAITIAGGAIAAQLSDRDQQFLAQAAHSGMLETQASELALQKAQTDEVRSYAQMMVNDHRKVDEDLKSLAQKFAVDLPTGLSEESKELISELKQREGIEFDKAYVDEVAMDAHETATETFESASQRAENEDIKAFASRHLPTLKKHLADGETLGQIVDGIEEGKPGATGGSTPASRTEPPQPDRRY